jgi:ribosome-associated protein
MAKVHQNPSHEDLGPSKSELKRQMTERQRLAEALSTLSRESLQIIPIEEGLRDALAETARIRSFEGIRRHKQYLGKLMRTLTEEEITLIKSILERIEGPGRIETAKLHQLERMRTSLLEDEGALKGLITRYPNLDIQNIRTLIRNAKKEREANKPPKAYREIFQYLRELEN